MNKDEFILVAKEEDIESMGLLTHSRIEMIHDIMLLMKKENEFPLGNKYRFAKIVREYFRKYGFADSLKENGSKWNLTPYYITHHMKEIQLVCAEKGKPFGYYRPNNDLFKGMYIFINKKQYIEIKNMIRKGINTMLESEMKETIALNGKGFNIPLPEISKVTLIGEAKKDNPRLLPKNKY